MVLPEMLNNSFKLLSCKHCGRFVVFNKSGLTLVEVLVALAIILILASVSLPMLGNWPFKVQTSSANAQLVQMIRLTRERSMARLNNQNQGIFFDNKSYTVFQGDSYANRQANYDVKTSLDKGLNLSWELTGSGGANEIVFNQDGVPSRQGKIILVSLAGEGSEININQLGIISFINDSRCTPNCLGKYCGDDDGCLGTCSALNSSMSACLNGVPRCGDAPACLAPFTCGGGGVSNVCGCISETDSAICSRLAKNCGSVTEIDNCNISRTVTCGTCVDPQTCGGGDTANVCGCTPETDSTICARLGKNCDSLVTTDNCNTGRTVACGVCASPLVCGGSGIANLCGCTSETNSAFCTRLGKNCGSVTASDNCGVSRTATCGTCTSPATCGGGGTDNVCGCTSETDSAFCSRLGKNCGSVTANDNCGVSRTVASCGVCTIPQYCGGGGTANVCGGCAPSCLGKCGGTDLCNGSCPNTCLYPTPFCNVSNMSCQSVDNHPSLQATSIKLATLRATYVNASWVRGNGQGVVVIMNLNSLGIIGPPVDGPIPYVCNSRFTLAPVIPTNKGRCVYMGSGLSVFIQNLANATRYIIKVYEYNLIDGIYYYNLLDSTSNPKVFQTPRA
jgi:prepilin-type N-terminal cleavage/methylation domain-containing protein